MQTHSLVVWQRSPFCHWCFKRLVHLVSVCLLRGDFSDKHTCKPVTHTLISNKPHWEVLTRYVLVCCFLLCHFHCNQRAQSVICLGQTGAQEGRGSLDSRFWPSARTVNTSVLLAVESISKVKVYNQRHAFSHSLCYVH